MFNFIISGKWPLLIFSHRLSHYDCCKLNSNMVFKLHPHLQVISFKLFTCINLEYYSFFLVKRIKITSFKKKINRFFRGFDWMNDFISHVK